MVLQLILIFCLFVLAKRRNHAWAKDAEDTLQRQFASHIQRKTLPSFREIRNAKSKHPVYLGVRSTPQIKSKMAHIISKKAK